MKVFVDAPLHLSRAMQRVTRALKKYAPSHVTIVDHVKDADLEVLHVIGFDALTHPREDFVVIQYCCNQWIEPWLPLWERARMVWSYYDLHKVMPVGANFYHSPLGVDPAFTDGLLTGRRQGVMTSGFVTGPKAEAIEEVVIAAEIAGIPVTHLGPPPVGVTREWTAESLWDVSDTVLASHYERMAWVSGLRQVEGFEMPVIEGLACGARPIVFDRPDMRQWYDGHAVFVPESTGDELVQHLVKVFQTPSKSVTSEEQSLVLQKFNWESIVTEFWRGVS